MRKLFFIAIAVLVTGVASAQKVQLGARVGIGSQNIRMEDYYEADSRLGWNLGVVSKIRLVNFGIGGLFFQPEIVYGQNTVKVNTPPNGEFKTRMNTIDIPLLVSARLAMVNVHAGPVVNVMTRFNTSDGDSEMSPERPAVGYAVGAGVNLGLIFIEGRYHGEFGKLRSNIDNGHSAVQSVRGSLSGWSVGVGVLF